MTSVRSIDLQVDVTEAAGLGEPAHVALTVTVPDELGPEPVVCFAKPGGGYARGYYTVDLPGPAAGAQADWHAAAGWVFVSVDHLGVGDSSLHDPERLSYTPVVAASQAAEADVLQKLAAGTLIDGLPKVERPLTIGIGQSMGGCLTVVQQGRYHGYDGIGVLGYSVLHTHPPTAPGHATPRHAVGPPRRPAVRRHLHQRPRAGRARPGRRGRAPTPWPGASTTTTSTPTSCGATWGTSPPAAATCRRGDRPPFPRRSPCGASRRAGRCPRRRRSAAPSSWAWASATCWSIPAGSRGPTSRPGASTSSSAREWDTCTTSPGRASCSGAASRRGRSGCGRRAGLMDLDRAEDLPSLLTLERVDRDLFRGRNANYGPRQTLYGGQVAAQCLLAAAATVEPDRLPHSFHGYFLRAGRQQPARHPRSGPRPGRALVLGPPRHRRAGRRGHLLHDHVVSRRERGWGLRRRAPARRARTRGRRQGRVEHAARCAPRHADRLPQGRLHRLPVGPFRRTRSGTTR